jgi:hypothetical protein
MGGAIGRAIGGGGGAATDGTVGNGGGVGALACGRGIGGGDGDGDGAMVVFVVTTGASQRGHIVARSLTAFPHSAQGRNAM